jgi:two-component system, cell cycle response regulator
MKIPTIRILLIQDNSDYAVAIRRKLVKDTENAFVLNAVSNLKDALDYFLTGAPDIVLLELSLPDSEGLATFEKIQSAAPQVPIVVLTTLDQELNALRAVQKGAQDYLLKTEDEAKLLMRIIRCTLERNRVKQELMQLSFTDELTGLHNRRGFSVLAEQQIKFSKRSQKGFFLILTDMNDFKQINDRYGHMQGDLAIIQAADILRRTFRQSDVIGRLGGDEFAILALEAGRDTLPTINQRLDHIMEQHNGASAQPYKLAMSVGSAYFDPAEIISFEQLFSTADALLYQQKRAKALARDISKKALG